MNFRVGQEKRGNRRLLQSTPTVMFNGKDDMCQLLFKLRDADYTAYAPNFMQEEYICDVLETCRSDVDYLLTKFYDQCFLRAS